jgi:hypothetical protein
MSLKMKRAQGMPGARRTRSSACKSKKHADNSTTGSPVHAGIPCAMVLRFPSCSLWRSGFVVTIPARCKASSPVNASVEASTARFPKFVRHPRPHFHELRKAKGSSKSGIAVPLSILKFLNEFASHSVGTSKSAALLPHDFAVRSAVARLAAPSRPSHPCPTFVTIAKRPS